jgi:hypothetical protein
VLRMIFAVRTGLRIAGQREPDPDHRIAGLQDEGAAVMRSELLVRTANPLT